MEAVAETSEDLMDRYFGGETFTEAEIRAALRTSVNDCSIVPMTMGSNTLHRYQSLPLGQDCHCR